MGLAFERLAEKHLGAITAIEHREQGSPWSEQAFRNELSNPSSVFLVALLAGSVVGYGGIWNLVDEAHVTTIMVNPEVRRQGLGGRLMNALLEEAEDAGMTCSTLEVRAGNQPAIRLYEKIGYVRTAVRKRYYPDNSEDAVVMWLYDLKKRHVL